MGQCCSGNEAGSVVESAADRGLRRRLSVLELGGTCDEAAAEEDRGALIIGPDLETIRKMLKPEEGASTGVISTGVETDKREQTMNDNGMGCACRKGLKPESPNQDSWSIVKADGDFAVYAVFDGHGVKGHNVSNFVKENLPKLIILDPRFKTAEMGQMLKDCFNKMQSMLEAADIDASESGTTATVVVHDIAQKKLTFAHVGDSGALLSTFSDASRTQSTAKSLTRMHSPDIKDERERIEMHGGNVVFDGYANYRVFAKQSRYPSLKMSRCLGDTKSQGVGVGLSCEPEVSEYTLGDDDNILIVCSNGVLEFLSPSAVADNAARFVPQSAMVAADKLAEDAWAQWIQEEGGVVVDDITACLIFLQYDGKSAK